MLRLAACRGIRGVVAFSDPVARFAADGRRIMPGHWGCTYQALNAWPVGRSTPRTHWVMPDGTYYSPRAMQKIRKQEQGHEYAERLLIKWGAPPMRAGQIPAEWLAVALRAASRGRTFRHPGNIRYAWAIGTSKAQRRGVHIALERDRAYPKSEVIIEGPRPLAA